MKKQLIALALAGALAVPQVAFAARDGEGMQYTSASEGFYGSIRTIFSSNGGGKDNGASIGADGSRLGVQGTLDLGHGLTGLYRYEWAVAGDNGGEANFHSGANGAKSSFRTRLSYVGLRGSFGEVVAGSHWEQDYNWVTAATDIATTGSGNFAPHFRRANSFQYTSPDINGFQGAIRFGLNGGSEKASGSTNIVNAVVANPSGNVLVGTIDGIVGNVAVTSLAALPPQVTNQLPLTVAINGNNKGSENLDEWAIAAKYATHGFTFGASYEVQPDQRGYALNVADAQTEIATSLATALAAVAAGNTPVLVSVVNARSINEDATFWALRLGYGQDNWGINGWYGEHNTSERGVAANVLSQDASPSRTAAINKAFRPQDTEIFSIAGNIDLGKIALVAIYEQQENAWALTDNVFLLNADYKFTSRSKAYIAYIANDFDSNPAKDDEVRIGLRMDF